MTSTASTGWIGRAASKAAVAMRAGFICLCLCLSVAPAFAQSGFDDPNKAGAGGKGGAGDLVPVNPAVDGGEISVGATAQIVVLFRNDSGRPLTTGPIQLYPSSTVSAAVALNQCSQEPLEPGATCAVSISVKALGSGNWRVEMLMRHSGHARLTTATISGRITESANALNNFKSDIEAIPNEIKFGTLQTSQSVVKGVVLRNTTSDPLDIHSIYIEASEQSGYSLKTDCERLDPGQACIVTVTWSPVLEGDSSGVLLVEHSGPTSVASIPLEGTFQPADTAKANTFPKPVPGKGLLVASQDNVDFGAGIQTTSAITVSLVNVGDAAIRLQDIRLAAGDDGLSINKNGCRPGVTLEPVEACPLTISWSPVREGAIIDNVQVQHDGARGVLVLPVHGTASGIISQDTKAVRLAGGDTGATVTTTIGTGTAATPPAVAAKEAAAKNGGGAAGGATPDTSGRNGGVDPASVLDGFIVTSHSPSRAIITGPGGSRIVLDGQQVVIGGFLWSVNIRPSGVEFRSGRDKVLLLFDESLSSVNRVAGQSGGSSGSSSGSGSSTSSTSAASTSAPAAAPK